MDELECKTCGVVTSYSCLKCHQPVCNMSLDCSIFASEEYPGWQMGKSVAFCKTCDSDPVVVDETDPDAVIDPMDVEILMMEQPSNAKVVACASRGFHHYRSFWKPKIHQQLTVRTENGNLHDPYSCSLSAKSKSKINGFIVVGHLPREISRFCKFFFTIVVS